MSSSEDDPENDLEVGVSSADEASTSTTTLTPKGSLIWTYFDKVESEGKKKAKCKFCLNKYLALPTGSTTSLHKHLQKKHPMKYSKFCMEKEKRPQLKKQKINEDSSSKNKTITDMLRPKWSPDSVISKKYTDLLANIIVEGMLPYSFVENKAFVKFVEAAIPQFKIPSRTTFSRSVIPKLYEHCKLKLKNEINEDMKKGIESFSFTTDGWTSRNIDSFMSLTVNYLTSSWCLKSFTLNLSLIEVSHDSNALRSIIHEMAAEWGFDEDLNVSAYIVTDNAPNIVGALKTGTWMEWMPCFSHTMQLAIEDAQKATQGIVPLFTKMKAIVGHYRRSSSARARLHGISKNEQNLQDLELIQYVPTRWWSELLMMERIIYLYPAITTEITRSKTQINLLTHQEVSLTESLVKILKPIHEATNLMGSEEYPTLSCVIPILHCINGSLSSFIISNPGKPGLTFARNLTKSIASRFPHHQKLSSTHVLATAVDPRFKAVLSDKSVIKQKIKTIIQSSRNEGTQQESLESTSNVHTTQEASVPEWFAHFTREAEATDSFGEDPMKQELDRYFDSPVLPPTTNPYEWWKASSGLYPQLAKVAQHYLPISASQIKSERLFSTAGNIVTSSRQNLLTEHTEQLVFLNANAKHFQK